MRLTFNDDDPESYGPWVAATDDGKYDAAGANPLDAVTALVRTIEWHALGLRDAGWRVPLGTTSGDQPQ